MCLEHRTVGVIKAELSGWMDAAELPRRMDAAELLRTILERTGQEQIGTDGPDRIETVGIVRCGRTTRYSRYRRMQLK